VRLKTTSGNGVILYASDVKHIDFISLYMKEGKVLFSFDCGTGEAVISSFVADWWFSPVSSTN
jgi:laminin alpha 3/5